MPFYNPANTRRYVWTIPSTKFSANVTNFTYMNFQLPVEFAAAARSDGMDIQVYDSSGNKLPRVVGRFDQSTGQCRIKFDDSASSTANNNFQFECGSGISDANDTAACTNSGMIFNLSGDNTLNDDCGAHNATGVNSPAYVDGPITGQKAIEFVEADSKGIYLNNNDELSFNGGSPDKPFTMLVFAKMQDASSCPFFNKDGGGAGGNREYSFLINGTDNLLIFCFDDSSGKSIGRKDNGTLTSLENNWAMIAATYTGAGANANLKLYANNSIAIDDVDNGNPVYTAMENKNDNLEIGYISYGPYYSDAHFCEMAMFNRVISGAEIDAYHDMILDASNFSSTGQIFSSAQIDNSKSNINIGIRVGM